MTRLSVSPRNLLKGLLGTAPLLLLGIGPLAGQETARGGDGATPSLGERLPVREITLGNGMRVLLLRREGAPTVSFVMRVGVGGVHEHLGTTGVAHLLEHLLFKGTESIGTTDVGAERRLFARADSVHERLLEVRAREATHPDVIAGDSLARAEIEAGRLALQAELDAIEDSARTYVESNAFDRVLSRAGARGLNATTTSEATSYFVELPANRAELFFALEADRMANPVFREFYTERDVVQEERRMRVETNPGGALYEAHMDAAYSVHPYGQPVVGYRSDLETLRRSEVAAYYRDYYGPNNAVLAVVGDIDPDEVEGWVRKYLEPIPAGREPPVVYAREPSQRGERRVEIHWDAEPALRIGWHVPAVSHPDAAALAVFSTLLTGGRTARLHRRLVTDERLASAVYSSMGPGDRYPRLFQIDATPLHPASTVDLESVIYEEVARLAAEGPAADEVERVRNQIEAAAVRRLQSNFGLALQLADSESLFGDWRATFRSTRRLRSVTAEDVQRVAGLYFDEANRTVATLVTTRGDGS
ncbi:MAG: insulinase family protein [Gemmatimonadetes bacterium]|nr:insulinase family protein [Gemmatimonadota bacterium]NNL29389.1 insulinase family protein [Gemmatimonadota bacterium]